MSVQTGSINIKKKLRSTLPPGARVEIRSEEWLVKSCHFDPELDAHVVKAEGTSGIVRGMQMTFLDILDQINIVDPTKLSLKIDDSDNFTKTKLFIDLWIKKSAPNTSDLVIGHKGIFNNEPYQREPAAKALDQSKHVRPRILMADAVGLGKTIQVGILLSELIRRGRAQRILVVCLKSMMSQLQKEFWSRFTIPLKAMDRQRVERVFREIPSQMNPFNYYDKIIMSMDTLKTDRMMGYLDSAKWDVIVIDECHNVARRGKSASDRSKLAKKLAVASDALILTSATPHDGTKESYASLLELIDPTLVTDPKQITKEALQNAEVVFRRFGKDLQLSQPIPPRVETAEYVSCGKTEEEVLLKLRSKVFKGIDQNKSKKKDIFFRTTLAKTMFSSPEAFLSTLNTRLEKLDPSASSIHKEDVDFLTEIRDSLAKYDIKKTAKYKNLLKLLNSKEIGKKDRVVIFSEFRNTHAALIRALSEDLGLPIPKDYKEFDKVAKIYGFSAELPEDLQQDVIESFATENSKIKLLITTDIASEGVNLHYFCNHLVHYDVPWSLITLEQRNGRIHRYGQKQDAHIYYIVNDSTIEELSKFKERYVVDKLRERSKRAVEDLGDAEFGLNVFDPEREAEIIAQGVQEGDLDAAIDANNVFDDLFGTIAPPSNGKIGNIPTLFDDEEFFKAAAKTLGLRTKKEDSDYLVPFSENAKHSDAIKHSLRLMTNELDISPDTVLKFSASIPDIEQSIKDARKKSGVWPDRHYIWENHPTTQLLVRQLEGTFEKDHASVVVLDKSEALQEIGFLVYGAIFNKKGQPIRSELVYADKSKGGKWNFSEPFEVMKAIGFTKKTVVNATNNKTEEKLKKTTKQFGEEISGLIEAYGNHLKTQAVKEHNDRSPKLTSYLSTLEKWHKEKTAYLNSTLKSTNQKRKLQNELLAVDLARKRFEEYVRSQFEVELKVPFVRVVSVFVANGGGWL